METNLEWIKLLRSERTAIGAFECDVWRIGGGARYTVLDTETGCYLDGGESHSLASAKGMALRVANAAYHLIQTRGKTVCPQCVANSQAKCQDRDALAAKGEA